ncbi:MAG: NAD+ synthase [Microthrixaceae bacterium]
MSVLRVALGQMNPHVGNLAGNVARLGELYDRAEAAGCDLVAFPELAVPGYPSEDLLIRRGFLEDNVEALGRLVARTGRCVGLFGYADDHLAVDSVGGIRTANTVAVASGGTLHGTYQKQRLPNYGVFDEDRYFTEGPEDQPLFAIGEFLCGVSICEDIWYVDGPPTHQSAAGADVLISLNASPFQEGKVAVREALLADRARRAGIPVLYVNQVGAQDELIFDGASMVIDGAGEVLARAPQFVDDLLIVDLVLEPRGLEPALPVVGVTGQRTVEEAAGGLPVPVGLGVRGIERDEAAPLRSAIDPPTVAAELPPDAEVWAALRLGVSDYFAKGGFTDACLGLSGGIDSALVAVLAADALGAEHVHAVSMPSQYSSGHSRDDAAALAANLGLDYRTIAIEDLYHGFLEGLAESFAGVDADLAEENLQARIRGTLLMALSNKFGWLALATGNKSEFAVGYSTIYGDTNGALAPIGDIYKTRVFRLARWRNELAIERGETPPIPESTLTKPPSAELRPDQRDDQSLPPYDELDAVLTRYVDDDFTVEELLAGGADPELARWVARLVDRNEFKRRQTPFQLRVTKKAFGRDRRMPLTNAYSEVRWATDEGPGVHPG